MNRFEALHALGLEEGASDEDVRLAHYGLRTAAKELDLSDCEQEAHAVEAVIAHAGESKDFLLNARNQSAMRKMKSYVAPKKRGKLTVTPVEEKTARLHGFERVRDVLTAHLDEERSRRGGSLIVLALCIVVSFILLRYLRATPRVVGFAIVGVFAIAGSTVLTKAQMHIRKLRPHVIEVDDRILGLKRELGLVVEEEDDPAVRRAQEEAVSTVPAGTPRVETSGPEVFLPYDTDADIEDAEDDADGQDEKDR